MIRVFALVSVLFGGSWAARAADGDAIAIINGRPLTRKVLVDFLIESRGAGALQQLVVAELAEQEARRRGLRVTQADIDQEYRDALDRLLPERAENGAAITDDDRERALQRVLAERGLTRAEYLLALRRNAYLRKIVQADFQIDDATLREEFARTYGERVEVRHIQISARNFQAIQAAIADLDGGTAFRDVVRKYSENPGTKAEDGLMPPFTFGDEEFPPAVREAAFSLKPGEYTRGPIRTGEYVHILQLERRIPSETRFEDVRERVRRKLEERNMVKLMKEMVETLYQKADVRVLDRDLRSAYEAFLKSAADNSGQALP